MAFASNINASFQASGDTVDTATTAMIVLFAWCVEACRFTLLAYEKIITVY